MIDRQSKRRWRPVNGVEEELDFIFIWDEGNFSCLAEGGFVVRVLRAGFRDVVCSKLTHFLRKVLAEEGLVPTSPSLMDLGACSKHFVYCWLSCDFR